MHAVSVVQHGTWGWRWEVVGPDGSTVAQGTASTYSAAIGRAWAAERAAAQSNANDTRSREQRRFG